ncbi:hypothetical protein DFH29DRAFT_1067267 [Suillus ampliporus]|nr:hypothetical protein DFH29DRAFT_1067267 [Suillus ampliporus]
MRHNSAGLTSSRSVEPTARLPRHHLKQHYKQNYGFWINDKWPADLGKHIRYPEDGFEPPNEKELSIRGFAYLRWAVDIDPLTMENCFQPEKNSAPPECLDVDEEVMVLSVCSDDEAEIPVIHYQEQVDYLLNLLGRQLQRWVNIWPRNDWE